MKIKVLYWLLMAAVFGAVVAGCSREKAVESEPEPPAPPPPPPEGMVVGEVTLQGEMDHSVTLVFLGGTNYSAYTDKNGFFKITGIAPGQYDVIAQREGYTKKTLDDMRVDENHPGIQNFRIIPVTLSRRKVVAEVIEKQLGALMGVARYADRDDHSGISIHVINSVASAVTDESGNFAIQNAEPGPYTLRISAKGYAAQNIAVDVRQGPPTQVRSAEKDPNVVTLQPLPAGAEAKRTVKGRVTMFDAAGNPVKKFDQVLVALEGTGYIALPNSEGDFVIDNVARGVYVVSAVAAGYQASEEKVVADLSANLVAAVRLRLQEVAGAKSSEGSARGRVKCNDAQSPAGASVGLAGTNYVALADAQGSFALNGIPAGAYSLIASLQGYQNGEVAGIVIEAGKETDVGVVELSRTVIPPTVLSTSPADGERNITVRKIIPVSVRFSEKMQPQSVLSALTFSPRINYRAYIGKQHPQSDLDLLYIELNGTGEAAIKFDSKYSITIGAGASDQNGVAMAESYTFSFTTGKAELIGTYPENGGINYARTPISGGVILYFNAPVRHDSLNARSIQISPNPGDSIDVICREDPETGWTNAEIHRLWTPGTRYSVTVNSGVKLADGRGSISNLPYRFSFSTASGQDIGRSRDIQNGRINPFKKQY
ncbi:MAG: carboxypeptidase regulatory-like domain-containing protein [Candidatus Sumerlaeota bacterium]|nr:carboxypeptidase regulatory-like domain-containing protein [Candidatus Sumerlaeota bacterium]